MKRRRARFHDAIRMARCLTLFRVINLVWLQLTYWIAMYFKVMWPSAGPAAISVEPTTACNLRCPECPSGLRQFNRPTGKIHPEDFRNWVKQISRTAFWVNLYFQGEPFLHPGWAEMVCMAKARHLYTMTSTNGHFLDEAHCRQILSSGLDRLVISLDGLDQQTYEAYRVGGSLEKVLEGIGNLTRMKQSVGVSHPYVVIQFLVLKSNEHQLEEVKRLALKPGIDEVALKSAQLYGYESGHPSMPDNKRFSRYRAAGDGRFVIKSALPNRCRRIWFSAVVTWNGRVVPCCYDKDAGHLLGRLDTEPLKKIWNGPENRRFRRQVFTGRKDIPICTNCGEGLF